MPIYITVLKSMAETVANINDSGKWWEEGKKTLEKMGIRVISAYTLLGRYDMMVIYEAPDEKVAMSTALVSSTGKYVPPRPGQRFQWKTLRNLLTDSSVNFLITNESR